MFIHVHTLWPAAQSHTWAVRACSGMPANMRQPRTPSNRERRAPAITERPRTLINREQPATVNTKQLRTRSNRKHPAIATTQQPRSSSNCEHAATANAQQPGMPSNRKHPADDSVLWCSFHRRITTQDTRPRPETANAERQQLRTLSNPEHLTTANNQQPRAPSDRKDPTIANI